MQNLEVSPSIEFINENLVFGWVSDTVQSNFSAWSTWKEYGDQIAANEFFQKTRDEAEAQGLVWFCCDAA